ncbi:DUF4199 domain-containing protein [Lacihabitans soyangensis]|uniref:DUF4199 domain-containing protein n=1 Tax=Lacihabitans soyangensis TaxID=869394 RepID=A0AAE3KTL7_9BACT|nr:DUF4199 domain-containing protein [Lacihabitans soyangensis]MCP9763899.1 DUF4199 domain-containing protein [Lacihabitans soyangensis]
MEKVSSARIALKWGLIYGIIGIVYNTVAYNTGLWKNWLIGLLAMLILLFGTLYLAFNEYKTLNAGFMTFKEGLGLGMLTVTTGGLLSVLFDNFYRKYIDPSLLEQQIKMITEQYESMGLSEAQIDEAVQKIENSAGSGLGFLWGVLGAIFVGFIASLIMSAIMKKDKPVFS